MPSAGRLTLGETVQGEQTLDGHIEPFSILAELLLRCHANRIAFDVEPIILPVPVLDRFLLLSEPYDAQAALRRF